MTVNSSRIFIRASALSRADRKPNGVQMMQRVIKGVRLRPRWISGPDDGKLICVLLILISTHYCVLILITLGPSAAGLLLSILHGAMH
jgi:hypothetical protein